MSRVSQASYLSQTSHLRDCPTGHARECPMGQRSLDNQALKYQTEIKTNAF